MAFDKATLGNRHTCYECDIKFYDLNKDPICPKPDCGADMRDNPNMDAREAFLASLSTRGRKKAKKEEEPIEEINELEDIDDIEEDDDDEDLGLSASDLMTAGEEEEPEL